MIIKLVRSGQSRSDAGEVDPTWHGDHLAPLTPAGEMQALEAGETIGHDFVSRSLSYRSPYRRTQQTMGFIIGGAGCSSYRVYEDLQQTMDFIIGGAGCPSHRVYEDPRLREVKWGFYRRMDGGESLVDCYDRISTFLETLMGQVERKRADRVLIVSHGTTICTFVTLFMYLAIEQYESMHNLGNCGIVTITDEGCKDAQFRMGKWAASGLRLRGEMA